MLCEMHRPVSDASLPKSAAGLGFDSIGGGGASSTECVTTVRRLIVEISNAMFVRSVSSKENLRSEFFSFLFFLFLEDERMHTTLRTRVSRFKSKSYSVCLLLPSCEKKTRGTNWLNISLHNFATDFETNLLFSLSLYIKY